MLLDIKMPVLGETTDEAEILAWFKRVGDKIERGEALLEVQTDKITVEVPALESGIVNKIIAQVGETIAIGDIIAKLQTNKAKASPKPKVEKRKKTIKTPKTKTQIAKNKTTRLRAAPAARRLAREHDIALASLKGSGPLGRISKADVVLALKNKSTKQKNIHKLTAIEKLTAKRTQSSFQEAPHFYIKQQIEMTAISNYLQTLAKPERPSINDVLVLAVAKTLKKHPRLNASFKNGDLAIHDDINIGVITATEAGLVSSVVKNADRLYILEIKNKIIEVRNKLKNKTAKPEDIEGASFTISNLGMFGVDEFSAIILPPNVAILALGRLKEEVLVRNGNMRIAKTISCTVSADHRALDGVMVAVFLHSLEEQLQNPESWLI